MKTQTTTSLIIRSTLALSIALIVASAVWSPAQAKSADPASETKMSDAKMMASCKEMMEKKQKLTEDMKAQDTELTAQLSAMNAAPAEKKMDLLAAVVTHMAEQRIAMDARKAKMEDDMMKHMMMHMQMGKDSMAQCPMMGDMKDKTDMKDMDDKSDDTHKDVK